MISTVALAWMPLLSFPAVLCGLLFLALFVAVWFRKNLGRRHPVRRWVAGCAIAAAAAFGMRDSEAIYSTAQAVVNVGDTASTNVYDAGNAASSDISMTRQIWFNVVVNTLFTSGGGATLAAVLQHSDDNAAWVDALVGPAIAVANLTVGTILLQTQPPVGLKRYTRIAYRVATAAMTAGKVDAYITSDIQRNVARPSGFAA